MPRANTSTKFEVDSANEIVWALSTKRGNHTLYRYSDE
jgi:hypothetical protein